MNIVKKSDGTPNYRYFESPDTLNAIEEVKTWLLKHHKKAKWLHDFEPGGGLCQILAAVFKFKVEQNWRKFDFQSPNKMERNTEMFFAVEKALQQSGLLKVPQVYIQSDLDKVLVARVRDIVKRHQAVVVDNESEATHVVFDLPDSEEKNELVRPVMRREMGVMVHWLYTPDSYDAWFHNIAFDQELELAPAQPAQWKVDASTGKRRQNDTEDATLEFEDPAVEPSVQEVHSTKTKSKDSEFNPPRSSTVLDLDTLGSDSCVEGLEPPAPNLLIQKERKSGIKGDDDLMETNREQQLNSEFSMKAAGHMSEEYRNRVDMFSEKYKSKYTNERRWTDQEMLLLLEAIEMFPDDWNRVSEHVGTRTPEECIRTLSLKMKKLWSCPPWHFSHQLWTHGLRPLLPKQHWVDEIPPALLLAHTKNLEAVYAETGKLDSEIGLAYSGIAGTGEEDEDSLKKEQYNENDNNQDSENSKDQETSSVMENGSSALQEEQSESVAHDDINTVNLMPSEDSDVISENKKRIQAAAAAALGAAAAKAKHLASVEERRIKALIAALVETQMKKQEVKLRHFEELETLMDREHDTLEQQRQSLLQERQQFYLDQLRSVEIRARHQAQAELIRDGLLPHTFQLNFDQVPLARPIEPPLQQVDSENKDQIVTKDAVVSPKLERATTNGESSTAAASQNEVHQEEPVTSNTQPPIAAQSYPPPPTPQQPQQIVPGMFPPQQQQSSGYPGQQQYSAGPGPQYNYGPQPTAGPQLGPPPQQQTFGQYPPGAQQPVGYPPQGYGTPNPPRQQFIPQQYPPPPPQQQQALQMSAGGYGPRGPPAQQHYVQQQVFAQRGSPYQTQASVSYGQYTAAGPMNMAAMNPANSGFPGNQSPQPGYRPSSLVESYPPQQPGQPSPQDHHQLTAAQSGPHTPQMQQQQQQQAAQQYSNPHTPMSTQMAAMSPMQISGAMPPGAAGQQPPHNSAEC
ncbi:SWI/SNF complex subunit SMARCC1 [Trichinella pseudospiralis]|uniref:SWI/SNF complex subunit SMARCC1 n=1 Tax=Trichinella pseudospiralis TaxID=6337 RepID=A0A0V0YGE9_TRIPS|nr:SWI/SNF complex subunit SMARCC1 [Trichinella pseudospiralis]